VRKTIIIQEKLVGLWNSSDSLQERSRL